MERKITKREKFEVVIEILDNLREEKGADFLVNDKVSVGELIEFATNEIEILDRRKIKDIERKELKKEAGDDLKKKILELLSFDVFKTQNDLLEEINDEEVSGQKVIARLSQLVREGVIEKENIKVKGANEKVSTKMGYRRISLR